MSPEVNQIGKEEKKGVIVYTNKHQIHRASVVSRENPERLESGFKYIKNRTDILDHFDMDQEFEPATREDLERVHEKSYIDFMEKYCENGGGFLGDSTYVQKGSCRAAKYSSGGAIELCDQVKKNYDYGFALIRPPGHHATLDNYGGYCLYNNSAVAARWLQEKRRINKVMIVDWDGHAANGTMRIFYDDPTVLTISVHRDPNGFYPHDGFLHQIGKREGRGYCVNVCLPAGSGDPEFKKVCESLVFPLANEFNPDFVIGCNGFDSHHSDPVVGLRFTSRSYHYIAKKLSMKYNGRSALLMEGGYEKFNGKLLHTLLSGLSLFDNPYEELEDNLSHSILQKGSICKETDEMLKELKNLLRDSPLGGFIEYENGEEEV
ncbi:MAG: histone deacetylase [Thermoplasmata archaeon]